MCHPQFDPRRFQLFDALAEPQCLAIRRVARLSSVPRRGRIYNIGDPSDCVWFLEAGIVKEAAPLPDGAEILLALLYPGDVFGESTLVDDGARDHLTEACEAANVWSVNRSVLLDLFNHTPAFRSALLGLVARRTRRLRMRVEGLLHKDAHRRVAQVLLSLAAERSAANANGLLIPLRVTQADLANMAGLARETVNIVLGHLRARGLVDTTRNSIRLRHRGQLLGSIHAMTSPIRSEVRHDQYAHGRPAGGGAPEAPDGADAGRVDRDARHTSAGGAGRVPPSAGLHPV